MVTGYTRIPYEAFIRYEFENGEKVAFHQKKKDLSYESKTTKLIYVNSKGEKESKSYYFDIFEEKKIYAIIGALRHEFGYNLWNSYEDFEDIYVNLPTVGYCMKGVKNACIFVSSITGESLHSMPELIDNGEKKDAIKTGSIIAVLEAMVRMLNNQTNEKWCLENITWR